MRTEYLLEPKEKVERWGPGIWTDEPDEAEWVDERTGLPCLVLRNMDFGTLAGYVGVPQGHPWHGENDPDNADAYRGITFAGMYEETGITRHVPATALRKARTVTLPGKPDELYLGHWFVGFDCAHFSDTIPHARHLIGRGAAEPLLVASVHLPDDPFTDTYKDFVWVRMRVEELALSAAEARS